MKGIIKLLFLFYFINCSAFTIEPTISEYRLVKSIFTKHSSNNDRYNNNTNFIGIEYKTQKDRKIGLGYFKNSFNDNSYFLGVGKEIVPFSFVPNFQCSVGIGIVKGYKKINYIYDKKTGEVLKKSKFNTNIGNDYIIGGSIGIRYNVTKYIDVSMEYVGAFIGFISIKIF